ncbi:MAG TPA: hypothetical protein VI685_19575 [Candidatus Angelobacter sp.]
MEYRFGRLMILALMGLTSLTPSQLPAKRRPYGQNAALSPAFVFTRISLPRQNASFISRRFLTDSAHAAALTDDFLSRSDKLYRTPFWFPNGGLLGATGVLDHAPGAVTVFLDHVSAYEKGHSVTFTIMPYLNGYSPQNTVQPPDTRLDLSNPRVRANIVAECGRYVSPSVAGSYVKGAERAFDGIIIDIEPAGDPAFFAPLKTLMAEIRSSFDGMGLKNKKIGIAAPQYTEKTPKPNWGWNSSDYHYMARYVNYIIAMTYDSGLEKPTYERWIYDQTVHILKAVSGSAWSFDQDHPQPGNGVKVLIGLPGFHTQTKAHNPNIENVASGVPGVFGAWEYLGNALGGTDHKSASYFQGAFMFSHDGGAADSVYARYNQDWKEWKDFFCKSC